MIAARSFIEAAREFGFRLYTGVPCSYFKSFINYVIDADELRYVGAANEGDAVAIAAGAELGGTRSIAMFQNSGLGNAVNPLTSLTHAFKIPVLLITTLRGAPEGPPDEPQHRLMGAITTQLLDSMKIPWEYFPTVDDEVPAVVARASEYMEKARRPYALIMKKGSVDRWGLHSVPETKAFSTMSGVVSEGSFTRREMLAAIQDGLDARDVTIATTGYTGRELYAMDDRPGQLYMVGSMGCASSLGLGLAIARPDCRVIVIDGDGAALMRMGAFATIGYERPRNLVHILLDNQTHESTGGQATVSHSIDFCGIASACGYPQVQSQATPARLTDCLRAPTTELTFIHVRIKPGTPKDLPRPTITPDEVADRLRKHLAAN